VLKPGGRLTILDSAQLVESAEIAWFLEAFEDLYHEPYFKGYLRDDLEKILVEEGFRVVESTPQFVAKLVVGEKPRYVTAA
jgi:hypothetical protein